MAKARVQRQGQRRRHAVAPASRPATPRIPTLPRNPGTIIGTVSKETVGAAAELTPQERELLTGAGWKSGDPIPDLTGTAAGRRLAASAAGVAAKAGDLAQAPPPVDPTAAPIEMPTPTNIEDMSPQDRDRASVMFTEMEEVRASLEAARGREQVAAAARPPSTINLVPGMDAAFRVAAENDQKQIREPAEAPTVELKDDLGLFDPTKKAAVPPTEPVEPEEPAAEPEMAPELAENSSQEQSSAGSDIADGAIFCPHCGCDLHTDPVVIGPEDKMVYLACIMGEHQRFEKEKALFGNRIRVVFRTLLPRETDLAMKQADKELADGQIFNQYHYMRVVENYRMLAGIAVVQRIDQAGQSFQPVTEINFDTEKHATAFVELKEYFDNEVFVMDSFRKAVEVQWMKFGNLVQALEARADDPDFFSGIE